MAKLDDENGETKVGVKLLYQPINLNKINLYSLLKGEEGQLEKVKYCKAYIYSSILIVYIISDNYNLILIKKLTPKLIAYKSICEY